MRRNLPLLGLSLFLGLLLWPLPASRGVVAGSDVPNFGRGDAALALCERPSAPRLTALLQGIRPRLCRLISDPSNALAASTFGSLDLGSLRSYRLAVRVPPGLIPAGARTRFPRGPPV